MRRETSSATVKAYDCPVSNNDKPLSALPSPLARATAFMSILIAGVFGGLIGYALVKVQCSGDCHLQKGLGILIGSLCFAIGMSIIAVLGLRAVGEWKEAQDNFDV